MGSSTFVMALIDQDSPHLRTLNLGDSAVWILRKDHQGNQKPIFKSEARQHRFNAPFQTGTGKKLPYMSEVYHHTVADGDLIVMGSDGVFDNMYESHILKCLKSSIGEVDVQVAATCLADKSLAMSKDEKFDSPFAIEGRKYGKDYPGGKEDDITVIVSRVKLN